MSTGEEIAIERDHEEDRDGAGRHTLDRIISLGRRYPPEGMLLAKTQDLLAALEAWRSDPENLFHMGNVLILCAYCAAELERIHRKVARTSDAEGIDLAEAVRAAYALMGSC